jgi:hypothetical protein
MLAVLLLLRELETFVRGSFALCWCSRASKSPAVNVVLTACSESMDVRLHCTVQAFVQRSGSESCK